MKHVDNITALILAGGLGTRLCSVVSDRPKVLAPVNGRPFLSYLLDQLVSAGFRDVILCTGYKGEMIMETFGDRYKDLTIRYSQEPEPLGTGGALRYALPMIDRENILAMNGDSFVDTDLRKYLNWHFQNSIQASLLLTHVHDISRYGRVEVNKKGFITRFSEKSKYMGPGWINAGVYIFKKDFLEIIPPDKFFSLEKQFFPELAGGKLYGYLCREELLDIGTPESYTRAKEFISSIEE